MAHERAWALGEVLSFDGTGLRELLEKRVGLFVAIGKSQFLVGQDVTEATLGAAAINT